ncbi:MAG: fumarylacetoacetate hydrolase family protein [Woeseiaceae bacterium]
MNEATIFELGDELYAALGDRTVVEPPTSRFPDITVGDAYRVSERILLRRIAAGESLIGRKVGLTNEVVQKFFRIDHPDFGNLTDAMRFPNGAEVPISELLIQPKVEGEIAFTLKRSLRGPGVTPADVLEATDHVAPCFEIVDSRVRDWQIRIADTVADNASSGLFVIGDQHADPRALDLSNCEMTLTADGAVVSEGSGAAALGSPLTCVAWLANALGTYDVELQRGDVILSGSLGPVVAATPDTDMKVCITGIGNASVRFT